MEPQTQLCHNPACPDRGQVGRGNTRCHSRQESRYRCWMGGVTFAATKGTLFYRLRTMPEVVTLVRTLWSHGGVRGRRSWRLLDAT